MVFVPFSVLCNSFNLQYFNFRLLGICINIELPDLLPILYLICVYYIYIYIYIFSHTRFLGLKHKLCASLPNGAPLLCEAMSHTKGIVNCVFKQNRGTNFLVLHVVSIFHASVSFSLKFLFRI